MGYGMSPKVTLVVVVCFFPMTVGLLDGYRSIDHDMLNLMRAMGASKLQIFRFLKMPSSLSHFFAGLRISVSYSIVGAVISEWLGGYNGLGVYMTRVKKSYAFDKMFAVIFLVSILSLLLMRLVSLLEKLAMPYRSERHSSTVK
jgi:ABC-type nitrate/sulfonate/bicarbonate transport system permease component